MIPVPLHRAKLRQRGFNQAELIARAAVTSHPSRNRYRLCASVLERKRDTTSQTGLTTHQRRENLRGAFGVLHPEAVKGFEVLVVDDVYTTGATVSECAQSVTPRRRNQSLGRNRGAHAENLSAAGGDRTGLSGRS